jgi:hypothetical protein
LTSQIDLLLGGPPASEAAATGPQSQIDPTIPVYGSPTTQSVRDNFATAQTEITALMGATQGGPFMPIAGGHFTGPLYLYNDPTDAMMPATKGYVDAGGSGGGGGIPEAPSGGPYGRGGGAWVPVLPIAGGTITGPLILAADPTTALGAVTKQYVDAISATANGAVQRAGDTMTGPLVLSADPTAALGAVTKQYADAGLALKAPLANPAFSGHLIVSNPTTPSLTLAITGGTGSPVFGVSNNGTTLGFGLSNAMTGVPTTPLATMDQSGNWVFGGRVTNTTGRIISTAVNSPTMTIIETGTTGVPMALWNHATSSHAGSLIIGIADSNGNPSTPIFTVDSSGPENAQGVVRVPLGVLTLAGTAITASANGLQTPAVFTTSGVIVGSTEVLGNGIAYQGSGSAAFGWQTSGSGLNVVINGTPQWVVLGQATGYQAVTNLAMASNFTYGILFQGASNYSFSITPSDRRLKSNIAPAGDALGIVQRIAVHDLDFQHPQAESGQHWSYSLISDEVEPLLPHAVIPSSEGGYESLHPQHLVSVLWRAVQQLADRLDTVEKAA